MDLFFGGLLLDLVPNFLTDFAAATEAFVRDSVPSGRVEFSLVDLQELEDEIDTGESIGQLRDSFAAVFSLPRDERSGLGASWRSPGSRTCARLGAGLDSDVLSLDLATSDSSGEARADATAALVEYIREVAGLTRPRRLMVSSIARQAPEGESGAALGYSGYYQFPEATVSGYPFLVMLTEAELAVIGPQGLQRIEEVATRFDRCADVDGHPVVIAALEMDWRKVSEASLRSWKSALGPLVPPSRKHRLGSLARFADFSHAVLPEDWPADRRLS